MGGGCSQKIGSERPLCFFKVTDLIYFSRRLVQKCPKSVRAFVSPLGASQDMADYMPPLESVLPAKTLAGASVGSRMSFSSLPSISSKADDRHALLKARQQTLLNQSERIRELLAEEGEHLPAVVPLTQQPKQPKKRAHKKRQKRPFGTLPEIAEAAPPLPAATHLYDEVAAEEASVMPSRDWRAQLPDDWCASNPRPWRHYMFRNMGPDYSQPGGEARKKTVCSQLSVPGPALSRSALPCLVALLTRRSRDRSPPMQPMRWGYPGVLSHVTPEAQAFADSRKARTRGSHSARALSYLHACMHPLH